MTILVTGGAGFIGSNFILHMLKKYPDYKLVNLDKLTYAGNLENLKKVEASSRYSFVQGDICDTEVVVAVLKDHNVETVVNFAAESHVDRSIMGASEFVRTNVYGTAVLMEAAKKHKLRKYVQISTDEVYGSLGPEGKFTETTHLHPNSPYAASKASADLLALAYHHTFSLPVVVTRCSNNYGPYQFPEKLIPLMVINAMGGKPLPVYGDGRNVRDWIHVEDHCSAIDMLLHEGREGEVYNIGGNSEMANIDIVKLLLKHLHKPESLITFVKDRPGHDQRYAIDATKIQREFGWKPTHDFERGLADTISWYQANQEWWKRIISAEYQEYYEKMYKGR
jgi:dTDP-glucose 4,6-dehydratase